MPTSKEQLIMNLGSGMLGKHHSKETKTKISEKKKGIHASPATEFKKGQKPWNTGKHLSEDHKRRISGTLKKNGISQKQIDVVTNYVKLHGPWNKGKSWSEEIKRKLSESHMGYKMPEEQKRKIGEAQRGQKHWNWKGGKSFQVYAEGWTEQLRESIRKRDGNTCQIRGERRKGLDVHHIDLKKDNHAPQNLVTLCRRCHIHLHNDEVRGSFQGGENVT
mgnify:CR=1 FL=1